jgi:putative ATPase
MSPEIRPLADLIRPKNLDEYIGQKHLVGPGKPLRRIIEQKKPFSMIFWGPPGVGKTTLAKMIAEAAGIDFVELSAVSAGKADIRQVVNRAGESKIILFLDEIHRFNKAQQDFLLPFVESGTIILIGATTENPSFEVIPPLLSRCQVFVLEELSFEELEQIIEAGAKAIDISITDEAKEYLITFANGDARKALNLLQATSELYTTIDLTTIKEALQSKLIRYDKGGEEHYNVISAFIKSMRASNPDAAIYYLARMVVAGEDPLFIARRMVIFASEDIGMAQPTALVVANEVFKACEVIGYPECAINLAHGVTYLTLAKKDRSANDALKAAKADVEAYGNLEVPMNLRNAPTKLMKKLGYGKGYEKYTAEDLLPNRLKGRKYYGK